MYRMYRMYRMYPACTSAVAAWKRNGGGNSCEASTQTAASQSLQSGKRPCLHHGFPPRQRVRRLEQDKDKKKKKVPPSTSLT